MEMSYGTWIYNIFLILMESNKQLKAQLRMQQNRITELYVLIDTLQTNLRSATVYLTPKELKEIDTQSYRWCVNWKPGDEKK